MNYSSLSALVADTSNFDKKIQDNFMNDGNSYYVEAGGWFKYQNFNVNYLIMNGDGQVFLSSSTSWSSYYVLNVNQRDMSSWNMWYQTGKISRLYNFVRVRWDGYSNYSSTADSCRLTFDVILLSNHRIYLYIADWPTSNANGNCNLRFGNGNSYSVTYKPSADGDKFTFIPADDNGTKWTAEAGFNEPEYPNIRYLLRDPSGKLYSINDGTPTALEETVLTAELFQTKGMVEIPVYSQYSSMGKMDLLCWAAEDYGLSANAIMTGHPSHMDVDTGDIAVSFKMNRAWVDGDAATKYQVSFDSGTTWYYFHNGDWTDSTADITLGNTKQEIHDIPMAKWQEKITASRVRFRCRMTSLDEYLKSIEIGNQQNYEDVYGEKCPY